MTPPADPVRYKESPLSRRNISHGVWLYYRFPLSYRDVQELLFERGIDVTHEAIRQWCRQVWAGLRQSASVDADLDLAINGISTKCF